MRSCRAGFNREQDGVISLPFPSVVRFLEYKPFRRRSVRFSRQNVYERDEQKCQYCNKHFPISDTTYDHVIPRCQGGKTSWTNIVTACFKCNQKKGQKSSPGSGYEARQEACTALQASELTSLPLVVRRHAGRMEAVFGGLVVKCIYCGGTGEGEGVLIAYDGGGGSYRYPDCTACEGRGRISIKPWLKRLRKMGYKIAPPKRKKK